MCCNIFTKEMNSQYNKTFPNLSIFHPCPTHSTQQPDCTALADFQSLKALHINQIEGGVGGGGDSSVIYICKI